MRLFASLVVPFVLLVSPALAQLHGVAVQVSGGKAIPTVAQLETVLNPGDFVRDVLGWHRVDPLCNLRINPNQQIMIPAAMNTLYQRVKQAGGKNFVTLGFNNKDCGMRANGGAADFPDTAELRAEFAAYAVRVVKQVPALGALSIWNEMNGTWDGGYAGRAVKLRNYCALANLVISEVRKVDDDIPIAIGATVGGNIDEWFTEMFQIHGCIGKGDPRIWLDVHPYLESNGDWNAWNNEVVQIRAKGISNPLIATEWGAKSAYQWRLDHPTGNYAATFETKMQLEKPQWAGVIWYQLLFDRRTPNASLFAKDGVTLTDAGRQYIDAFEK